MTAFRTLRPEELVARPDDLLLARAQVTGAAPGPTDHEEARDRILAFLDDHPDALHRSCLEGHLTGSALVLDHAGEHLLLLLHAKVRRWLQPGGHADGDGNLAHVSLREAAEESGIEGLQVVAPAIDLDVHVFHNAATPEPDHLHLDVRHLLIAPAGAVPAGNHESHDVRWISFGDLAAYDLDPGTRRMATAARAAFTAVTGR